MTKPKQLPSQQYLNECFSYFPETGELLWKERPLEHFKNQSYTDTWNNRLKGLSAAKQANGKYYRTTIGEITTATHRVIWKLMTGEDPIGQIDHINGDGFDNKFSNLRDVTESENQHNRKIPSDNKSGCKGVSYVKDSDAWQSMFNIRGNGVYLGTFKNKEDAIKARKEAETKDWSHLETKIVKKSEFELTSENINECFDYNPETGIVKWKERPISHFKDVGIMRRWNTRYAGNEIIFKKEDGYLYVTVSGKIKVLQRVIYWLHTGEEIPLHLKVDHMNGVRHDNRWCNLRLVSVSQNGMNSKNNSDKLKGCSFDKQRGKWRAGIVINGKRKCLGQYKTEQEAHEAYCKAANEYFGEYANHG